MRNGNASRAVTCGRTMAATVITASHWQRDNPDRPMSRRVTAGRSATPNDHHDART